MPDRLLIVDGHNLLFRAFFGIPARVLPSGKAVHGIIGFLGLFRKIVARTAPTHVVVVFDSEETGDRHVSLPEYKAQRRLYDSVPAAENPFSQLSDIMRALTELKIAYLEIPGYEADDVIASYASFSALPTTIASWDSDFFQLISDRITILRYNGKATTEIDAAWLATKFGITPLQYPTFKALVGDTSDNILGVRGIGPKKASSIVRGQAELRDQNERDMMNRNIDLITLRPDPKLFGGLDACRYGAAMESLRLGAWLKEIGVL